MIIKNASIFKGVRHAFIAAAAIIVASACLLVSCIGGADDEKVVTVTLLPQKYLLEQIVGDKVKVLSLLSASSDPETYDPSMSHLMNIDKSMAYIRIGNVGFEDAIIDRVSKARPDMPIFDSSRGVELIYGTHTTSDEPDPHVWASVANARIIARNMYEAMTLIDSANAEYYHANFTRLQASLDSLDRAMHSRLDSLHHRAFVVMHPELSYLAADYGLTQVALGAENKESSVTEFRDALTRAKRSGARVMFTRHGADSRRQHAVLDQLGISETAINLADINWPDNMLRIADALAEADNDD